MNASRENDLVSILEQGAAILREAGVPAQLAKELDCLAGQVNKPCVLAVVGRMKAGKSTFINALLGEDVAKVGVTETTATINCFMYGTAADPSTRALLLAGRPVRGCQSCIRRCLQGNDADSLRRAEGIDHLEYLLPNDYLRNVTLVDTPGTAAVVDEHQNRTAEFLNLQKQLRERRSEETQRIGSEADAVIYLVGQVPRATDQAFLEEFGQATAGRSRALNAVGVMAKIDLQAEILARRQELAGKIAEQLKSSLNTVVPVSAGIRRALDHLLKEHRKGLVRLIAVLRRIPPHRLQKLLDSEELYRELESDDCPVTTTERSELLGDMEWGVFTAIARLAANPALTGAAVVQQLDDLSGFGPLKDVLERHFFKRAWFLHCYRLLSDARKVLSEIRYQHLPAFRNATARTGPARTGLWASSMRPGGSGRRSGAGGVRVPPVRHRQACRPAGGHS